MRRQLMQKWADFVDQPWQDGANSSDRSRVISLHPSRVGVLR